jgi:hypothetical protein
MLPQTKLNHQLKVNIAMSASTCACAVKMFAFAREQTFARGKLVSISGKEKLHYAPVRFKCGHNSQFRHHSMRKKGQLESWKRH